MKILSQFSLILCLLGSTLVFWVHTEVERRINPDYITLRGTTFDVGWNVEQDRKQRIDFFTTNKRRLVYSLTAWVSNSLLCSGFFIFVFDIDGDGYDDIYYKGCDLRGFLKYDPNSMQITDREIGDTDPPDLTGLQNFWFQNLQPTDSADNRIISGPGWILTTFGAALALVGLLGCCVGLVGSLLEKKAQD